MKKQRMRLLRLSGITAVVLSAGLWMLIPAWGQTPTAKANARDGRDGRHGGTGTGNTVLTKDIAQARMATAKYATNLAKAQADGYKIITKMMPNMGYHFLNPGISGFDVRKPPILVYEHTSNNTWQLGALEWVFTSIPKTPPLPNATFGFFPAGCHYNDGTFVPEPSQQDCPATAPGSGASFFFWHPTCTRCTSGSGTRIRRGCTPARTRWSTRSTATDPKEAGLAGAEPDKRGRAGLTTATDPAFGDTRGGRPGVSAAHRRPLSPSSVMRRTGASMHTHKTAVDAQRETTGDKGARPQ